MAAIKKPVVLAKNLLILIFSLRRYVIEKSMINDEKPTIPNLIKTEKIDLILKLKILWITIALKILFLLLR